MMHFVKGDYGFGIKLGLNEGKPLEAEYRIGKSKIWRKAELDAASTFRIPNHIMKRLTKTTGRKSLDVKIKLPDGKAYRELIPVTVVAPFDA